MVGVVELSPNVTGWISSGLKSGRTLSQLRPPRGESGNDPALFVELKYNCVWMREILRIALNRNIVNRPSHQIPNAISDLIWL